MLKLGVIGTSWICRQFIDAAIETGKYELKAAYSRSLEKGEAFVSDFPGVYVFDDLANFVNFEKLDVIYIASPNSLHYSQTKAAVESGKSVIVEKPAFSNPKEWDEIHRLAHENGVYVLEAARHIHELVFQTIKDFLSDKTITGANLIYAKYSTKMPALLAGELPNKWNPKFSGGILADLGVYLVYWAIGQFGLPEAAHYKAQLLPSGVDVSGYGLLRYGDFDVSLYSAGNSFSYQSSEVYTTDGTLIIDSPATPSSIQFVKLDGNSEQINIKIAENPLFAEADDFADFLSNPTTSENKKNYADWTELSKFVNQILFTMRQDAAIVFDADIDD
ncbi:MAG: Gfo/Idh/MocA family oxidoreductase [Streptococcaceae bacterium]|jgi:predicted dehydrogenase|nr:Gfo/Idh/MocA family oxidoreductase [Streptococcaceae bacterium]